MTNRKLRIVVGASLGASPGQGGWAWVVLQYLLGLRRLGHQVTFVEPLALSRVRPAGCRPTESENALYFRKVLEPYGLLDCSSLIIGETRETVGLDHKDVLARLRSADVLLNVSGRWTDLDLAAHIPVRVYLDLDPAFTQLWQVAHGIDMHLDGHTHHVTVGQSIGRPECSIPTCGRDWLTTHQPIALEYWPVAQRIHHEGLTTIANWRGYGSAEYQGVFYGQKAHSLRPLIDIPSRCRERFILALGIDPQETHDLERLREHGWELLDPLSVAEGPDDYQRLVQGSKGEFGIAKSGYVVSRCGWFSDRSTCYLASGRPVVAQDTGFSHYLPTGRGLFAFDTAEQLCEAVQQLNQDYSLHARAARQLAEEFFDSRIVLTRLLERVSAL